MKVRPLLAVAAVEGGCADAAGSEGVDISGRGRVGGALADAGGEVGGDGS